MTGRIGTIATAVALMLSGCAVRRGGGKSETSGGTGVDLTGAASAPQTTIRMVPPAKLSLNGQAVVKGRLVIEEAVTHRPVEGALLKETVAFQAGTVVVDATIGKGNHDLFSVSAATEVLELVGYFDATEPDLAPATFNVTVFGDFDEALELTIFLPAETSNAAYQVTGATKDGTSTNLFTDEKLPESVFPNVLEASEGEPGNINSNAFPLNFPLSPIVFVPHGTLTITPGPGSGGTGTGGGSDGTSGCSSGEIICGTVCCPASTPVCGTGGACCSTDQKPCASGCCDAGGTCPPSTADDCASCCPNDSCCKGDLYCCGDCDTGCDGGSGQSPVP
jgi:hypothetical protein